MLPRYRPCFLPLAIVAAVLWGCDSSSPPADEHDHEHEEGDGHDHGDEQAAIIQIDNQVVELACGECKFEMTGDDCDLAVRIDGKAYFVDGKSIDDFGDAHASDGMCNAIHKARVTGRIENGRFIATAIELLPQETDAG